MIFSYKMPRSKELSSTLRAMLCELRDIGWSYPKIHSKYPDIPLSTIRYTTPSRNKTREITRNLFHEVGDQKLCLLKSNNIFLILLSRVSILNEWTFPSCSKPPIYPCNPTTISKAHMRKSKQCSNQRLYHQPNDRREEFKLSNAKTTLRHVRIWGSKGDMHIPMKMESWLRHGCWYISANHAIAI